ncbi:hypothetical protein ACL03H_15160 [Saccharopolyspora sp. MS10]|uniref:hypothetical protein n=1 Tax=Saccharopolyspora sp. MS10 TaxID=3385973 RepID=UPI0039A18497
MSDSPRRAGGGRAWRLLARSLVVAGAATAGTSVGWFAAQADPVLDLSGAAPAGSSATERPAAGDPLGALVHHVAEPLVGDAAESGAGQSSGPQAAAPEESGQASPGADPGRFSLDELAPQHLVGRVAEAEPVSGVLDGAGHVLRPVGRVLEPEPGAEPPLAELTRPVVNGLGELTAPLRPQSAPVPAPSPAPSPVPAPAPAASPAPAPVPPQPTTAAPAPNRGPAAHLVLATDTPARAEVTGAPTDPGSPDRPWHPGKPAVPPPPVSGSGAHSGDGSGGPSGVGLSWPPAASAAHLAGPSSALRSGSSALRGTFAASPGTTPD